MDHAFTDRMVREDRVELTQAALDYLKAYKGSFKPLLDARTAHLTGEVLNVAEIRMILNCMRSDTSVRMEYTPPEVSNVIDFPRSRAFYDDDIVVEKRRLELPVRGKINRTFATSTSLRAEVIHEVNQDSVRLTFKRAGAHSLIPRNGWQVLWYDRIEVDFRYLCGAKPTWTTLQLLTVVEAREMIRNCERRYCPGCVRVANA